MILITGCARSGTSLTTRILQAHGCWLGEPGIVNTLYENVAIREDVLKPILRAAGADPAGQRGLPRTEALSAPTGLRDAVMAKLRGGNGPLAYKDAKITLTWPVWAEAFPEAKWVLVRRDPLDIADSCMRTSFMSAYSTHEGWFGWVREHERRFEDIKEAGLDLIEVWPKDFIADPQALRPVAEHCGLEFNPDAVRAAVDPTLYRMSA